MPIRKLLLSALAGAALTAQTPPSKPAGPDDVVATVEGEKLTPRQIQKIRASLPQPFAQSVMRMDNRSFLKSYAGLLLLSRLAEKEKFAEREPYKDQLAFLRMNYLAQAYLDGLKTKVNVSQEDIQQYYDQNKDSYTEAQVRAIYVAFSPNAGKPSSDPKAKKLLTEEQAKAKAEKLAAQAKTGADFAKLAKENSDDASSAEKGGDIGPLKRSASAVPEDVKQVIFAMKPGEVGPPLRQPAGYYVFKLDGFKTTPFAEVAGSIATTVQGQKIQAEYSRIMSGVQVSYDNEEFFKQPPPAPPAK